MSWVQVKSPNLNVQTSIGMCLKYVQDAYGSGWAGSYALQGWRDIVKKKHADRNIPGGVYVPIWFEGYWNGVNYGHVAIYKDGVCWSSPYSNKGTHDQLGNIETVERIYGMKYIGWSEDIGGTTVIRKGDNDMVEDIQRHFDIYSQTFANATGRKLTRNEFRISFVGRDKAEVQTVIHQSAETAAYARLAADGKKLPTVQGELTKSKAEVAQVKAQLSEKDKQIAAQSKEISELLAQVALQSEDTKNLNALGQALQWFVSRVGLNKERL